MAVLVERATSDLLGGPDWGLNLEICDAINQNPSSSRDVVKAVKKRLSNKSAKVQILALTVLEMIMKNCGDPVHQLVAEKDVLQCMVKIVKRKADASVREKILALLESWQRIFGGPKGKYPQYSAAYDGLQRSGVQFPIQDVADTALFIAPATRPATRLSSRVVATETTLAASHTTRSLTKLAYGLPSPLPTRLDEVLAASENFVWSAKDLDAARQGVEVLNEMLNALDSNDKQAIHNDVIMQLVEQCETNKKIVRQLVNSTSDESLLFQGLSLNDDLQQVLSRHSLLSSLSPPAEDIPKSPRGLVVYGQEDDEAEDEPSHLARWSSKPSYLSASRLEAGLQRSMEYSSSQQSTASTAGSHQPNVDVDSALATPPMQVESSKSPSVPDENMVNPFANMASIPMTAVHCSSSSILNDPTLLSSELASSHLSHHEQSASQQNYVSNSAASPKSPHQDQGCSYPLLQRQHASQVNGSILVDDDDGMMNPFSSLPPQSPASEKKVSNLPPPPILYTERKQFFEERRQMNRSPNLGSTTPSSVERRLKNFILDDHHDEKTLPAFSQPASKFNSKYSKKEVRSHDRLFEDLVDFRAMKNKV